MKFYILFKHQKFNEALELGDLSFGTLYGEVGLEALQEILKKDNVEELLKDIIIKDEKSKIYSVVEFLDILDNSHVFTQKNKEGKWWHENKSI